MKKGSKHTKQSKEKIGKSGLGRPAWNKNIKVNRNKYPIMGHFRLHTNETKKKIGLKGLGRIPPNKGKEVSEEQKKKISETLKTKYRNGMKNASYKHGLSNTKEMQSYYELIRESRKQINGGFHTFEEWQLLKAQYNWTCPCCKKREPEIKLGADHIIPISKGGSSNIENIQPLCFKCNIKKQTKIIKY